MHRLSGLFALFLPWQLTFADGAFPRITVQQDDLSELQHNFMLHLSQGYQWI